MAFCLFAVELAADNYLETVTLPINEYKNYSNQCYTVEIDSGLQKPACFDTLVICIYQFQERLALWKEYTMNNKTECD